MIRVLGCAIGLTECFGCLACHGSVFLSLQMDQTIQTSEYGYVNTALPVCKKNPSTFKEKKCYTNFVKI